MAAGLRQAAYQTALQQVFFSNASENPSTTPRDIAVTISDGEVDSNTAHTTVTVIAVNDAPVAASGSASGNEDTAISGTVTASDVDNTPAQLSYALVGAPRRGGLTVALNANGTFTYTPAANFNGSDSFSFKASDGSLNSNVATESLTVTAVNDAPVAANGSASGTARTRRSHQP